MRIGVLLPLASQPDTGLLPAWGEVRDFALHAEGLLFNSLWVFDHFYDGGDDRPRGPIYEAWSVQAALAALTTRVELGQLVMCTAFRSPGLLGKMAATADEISGGRLTLGVGAGWYDREYEAFGYPTDHRYSRFDESLDILAPLLGGETVSKRGRINVVSDATLIPPPRRRIPILIGGTGPRMVRLVAHKADGWNTAWHAGPSDRLRAQIRGMKAALQDVGRDPASLRWTVGFAVRDQSVASCASAIQAFADLGFDDVIATTHSASRASLDLLAEAASEWL